MAALVQRIRARAASLPTFDIPFLLILLLLLSYGLIMLFSAGYAVALYRRGDAYTYIRPQLLFAALGVLAMYAASLVDYHVWHRLAWPMLGISLLLLAIVLFMPEYNGCKRWIVLPGLGTLQPSEIAKFSIVLVFSHIISLNHDRMKSFSTGVVPFALILGVVTVLMLLEPHLSGTLLILSIGAVLMFVGGTGLKWFALAGIAGAGAIAAAVVLLSILLSQMLTRKISTLLTAIRKVRAGAYEHRTHISGRDEIAQIGEEFNSLTDRLQTTETLRRRFVSDASHELKTPLAAIRLLTDSILQTDQMDMETVRDFVTDIGSEAERLSRITEDLLRLTRLDSGVQDAAYPVSVSRVLERVVRMLGIVAREKEVTLTYEANEDAVVRATEDDIHQILYNLIENGIKYSGSMGFVHTALHVTDSTVEIRVEDNGIGIPDEDMEHVFERFYRVDKNRSRAVGGTGLGLSIVSDTVRRRGGAIRAEHRQSGSGTVFIVELPLARREEDDT